MGSYTPDRYGYPRGLDEVGLRLSLPRISGETQTHYRKRLLLQARQPPGPSLEEMILSANRTVGEFDKRIMKIELVLDSDGAPIVDDPCIIIAATRLFVYSNFASLTLAATINIWDRTASYFLRDVYNKLSAIPFIAVTKETEYDDFLYSKNIRIGASERYQYSEILRTSRSNKLEYPLIKTISFNDYNIFSSEKNSKNLVLEAGDYYIDKVNGVVFSYSTQRGQAFYSYRDFPFYLWCQPVRVEQGNDPTLRYATRDTLINQVDGQEQYSLLNEYGAKIAAETLSIHPMKWGQ